MDLPMYVFPYSGIKGVEEVLGLAVWRGRRMECS